MYALYFELQILNLMREDCQFDRNMKHM